MSIRKPNRRRAKAARKTTVWCYGCDAERVTPGRKCRRCGLRMLPRRNVRGGAA
jgi:hypothetical protein